MASVSLQLSCISAGSSAPHVCQTNSSKPKTLTMFLSKVKLHLDDARQYCLHEVKPKAIPFIILLRKVTSGLITWQPLGIIWKHARHWREVFVSSDRSPYEELPATQGDIDKKKKRSSGAEGDGGAMFAVSLPLFTEWELGRGYNLMWDAAEETYLQVGQSHCLARHKLQMLVSHDSLAPSQVQVLKFVLCALKNVTAPFPKCVAILAMLVAWLCGCMDVSPSISSEISNNYCMDCQEIFPSGRMMIILVMGFYLSIIIIHYFGLWPYLWWWLCKCWHANLQN